MDPGGDAKFTFTAATPPKRVGVVATSDTFEQIRVSERESFDRLLRCLSGYLEESKPVGA